MILDGKPGDVAVEYERLNYDKEVNTEDSSVGKVDKRVTLSTLNPKGKNVDTFEYNTGITLKVEWTDEYKVGAVGFLIYKNQELIFATNSFSYGEFLDKREACLNLKLDLGNGRYNVRVGLFGQEGRHDFLGMFDDKTIVIYNQPQKDKQGNEYEGVLLLDNEWIS